MLYMNDYDLSFAKVRFDRAGCPNRYHLATAVDSLREWADRNSDGWAYWPKPARAARKAMLLIQSTTNAANTEQEMEDATDAETKAALAQIKRFLTTQGVDAPTSRRIVDQW